MCKHHLSPCAEPARSFDTLSYLTNSGAADLRVLAGSTPAHWGPFNFNHPSGNDLHDKTREAPSRALVGLASGTADAGAGEDTVFPNLAGRKGVGTHEI